MDLKGQKPKKDLAKSYGLGYLERKPFEGVSELKTPCALLVIGCGLWKIVIYF